jgi:ABC-type multidrug transport system ATPase subunit
MIELHGVTHHFGTKPVLRDISMTIDAGQVVALMGPNGMGKSTLLGVMAGLLSPIVGTVKIDGRIRRSTESDELAIRQKVFYLPAEPALPTSRTGREWIIAVGRLWGIPDLKLFEHAHELLTLFDLQEKSDSVMSSYSTGQQKKIALCAMLVTQTPILLLDEPFSGGLDPSGIATLKRILQHLAKGDHHTIVMATPVPELVEEIADRVGIIRSGELIAYDTVSGLQKQTGITGNLAEVYDHLVSPGSVQRIDAYFAEKR